MNQHIFLIGFMGVGKTTVAEVLCTKLGVSCVEMDQTIAEEQQQSIPDIFETYGEEYFRQLETDCLFALCQKEPCVVSCGGGTVLRDQNVEMMKKHGHIFLLTATAETILSRVKDSEDRPLLNGHKNTDYIEELMGKRREKYEAAADFVIKTDNKSVDIICADIISQMESIG